MHNAEDDALIPPPYVAALASKVQLLTMVFACANTPPPYAAEFPLKTQS